MLQEEEFYRGPTTKTLESLISINNKLQQPDAAAGVLVYAQKHMQHQGDFVSGMGGVLHRHMGTLWLVHMQAFFLLGMEGGTHSSW